jgi:hypothetical protein
MTFDITWTWEDEKRAWRYSSPMPSGVEIPKGWGKGKPKEGCVPLWDVSIPATLAEAKNEEHPVEGQCWTAFQKKQSSELFEELTGEDDEAHIHADFDKMPTPHLDIKSVLAWELCASDVARMWADSMLADPADGFAVVDNDHFEGRAILTEWGDERTSLGIDKPTPTTEPFDEGRMDADGNIIFESGAKLYRPQPRVPTQTVKIPTRLPAVTSKSGRALLNVFYGKGDKSRIKYGSELEQQADDILKAEGLDPETGDEPRTTQRSSKAENLLAVSEEHLHHVIAYHLAKTYEGVGTPDLAFASMPFAAGQRAIRRRNGNRSEVHKRARKLEHYAFHLLRDANIYDDELSGHTGQSRPTAQLNRTTFNKLLRRFGRNGGAKHVLDKLGAKTATRRPTPTQPSLWADWHWILEEHFAYAEVGEFVEE